MRTTIHNVCADCLLYVAYGEHPEDSDPSGDNAREAFVTPYMHAGETELGFSWRACECCGARAGERHEIVELAPV